MRKLQGTESGIAISNLAHECLKLAIFIMRNYTCFYCKMDLEMMTKKDTIGFSQATAVYLAAGVAMEATAPGASLINLRLTRSLGSMLIALKACISHELSTKGCS